MKNLSYFNSIQKTNNQVSTAKLTKVKRLQLVRECSSWVIVMK